MTRELLQKVAALGAGKVVLTGVSFTPDRLGAMGYDSADGRFFTCLDRRQTGSYHGTGDIFAATGVGGMMRGLPRHCRGCSFVITRCGDRASSRR